MSQDQMERVSLATLRCGAAIERFDDALQAVLENIADPNMRAGAREVILKVKITPDRDRKFCSVAVDVVSKLRPAETFSSQMFLGVDHGKIVAFEHNPEQMQLGLDRQVRPGVTKFPMTKEG